MADRYCLKLKNNECYIFDSLLNDEFAIRLKGYKVFVDDFIDKQSQEVTIQILIDRLNYNHNQLIKSNKIISNVEYNRILTKNKMTSLIHLHSRKRYA